MSVLRSWFKWLLIVAVLLVSSGGNAHAVADHAVSKAAVPCASHPHLEQSHPASHHQDCCCSCFSCPAGLVTLVEPLVPSPVAYSLNLSPAGTFPLATRFLLPELDPPRPSALS